MYFLKFLSSLSRKHFSTNAAMDLKLVSSSKCFEGEQRVYSHHSKTLKCDMNFGVYMPPAAIGMECPAELPVLYYLSGLTCTHENFIQKSGVQQYAAKHGLIVVNPDTSPRNLNLPGENDSDDFGTGAGFYVDAVKEPWSKHYRMYSYVTQELPELIKRNLPVHPTKKGIFGHSMGGHGALICALKNPGMYKSVSVFAPVANPVESKLGNKAFTGYLGEDRTEWEVWDSTCLAKTYAGTPLEILVDQGNKDGFLSAKELLPENFVNAAATNDNLQVIYKVRDGYDHGYFYVSTFIADHIAYHAKILKA